MCLFHNYHRYLKVKQLLSGYSKSINLGNLVILIKATKDRESFPKFCSRFYVVPLMTKCKKCNGLVFITTFMPAVTNEFKGKSKIYGLWNSPKMYWEDAYLNTVIHFLLFKVIQFKDAFYGQSWYHFWRRKSN